MLRQVALAAACVAVVAVPVPGCRERVVIHTGGEDYAPPPPAAVEPADVDVSFFYERLAPYGTWYRHPAHGWVWAPANVPVGWRPYTDGHWVWADECGWTWVSDWPWGWAPFHYGRWDYDDALGWVWVPGRDWAPAWVVWRSGGGYVGWAPLPPQARWREREGLDLRGIDLDGLPRRHWVFIRDRDFLGPVREHEVLPERDERLFSQTRNITKYREEKGRVVVQSIPRGDIERAAGRRVEQGRIQNVPSPGAMGLPREREDEVRVYRPRVNEAPPTAAPPPPERIERRHAAEAQELREGLQAQREQIERQQEAERRRETQRRATSQRMEELRKRQEAQKGAIQAEQERQQRLLEQRHARERTERRPVNVKPPEVRTPEAKPPVGKPPERREGDGRPREGADRDGKERDGRERG